RRQLSDRSAENARRGFIDARLHLSPKFFQPAGPKDSGGDSEGRPSAARHCLAPSDSITFELFLLRHESSSRFVGPERESQIANLKFQIESPAIVHRFRVSDFLTVAVGHG